MTSNVQRIHQSNRNIIYNMNNINIKMNLLHIFRVTNMFSNNIVTNILQEFLLHNDSQFLANQYSQHNVLALLHSFLRYRLLSGTAPLLKFVADLVISDTPHMSGPLAASIEQASDSTMLELNSLWTNLKLWILNTIKLSIRDHY